MMLKSTIAKLVKYGQRVVWAVLLWMPLMALADDPSASMNWNNVAAPNPVALANDPSTSMNWNNIAVLNPNHKSFFGTPDIVTMLENLDKSIPYLFYMVGGLTYLFGITLVLSAIWKFKKWGEGVSMVAQKDAREPIMHLAIGVLLIFAPSTMRTLLVTVFGTGSIFSYIPTIPDLSWQLASDTVIAIVQFVGFVAIVRGLLHLHKAVGGQAQQNMFSKGIIHLVGGVLSMNIVGTKDILYSTLGLSS